MQRDDEKQGKKTSTHPKVVLDPSHPTKAELKHGAAVPKLAFAALTGAAITVFLNLALLFSINHKKTWPDKGIYGLVQPASVISLLLSFTALFIGYAYEEGFANAWWRMQHRPDITVKDLQSAHAAGKNLSDAVLHFKHQYWIAIGYLSLFLLSVNSFVLQGAISTSLHTREYNTTIQIPIVRQLDAGFSLASDENLAVYASQWTYIWQQIQNPYGSAFTQYAYFGHLNWSDPNLEPYHFGYDETSTYSAQVEGAGFEAE